MSNRLIYQLTDELVEAISRKDLQKIEILASDDIIRYFTIGDKSLLTYSLSTNSREIFEYLLTITDIDRPVTNKGGTIFTEMIMYIIFNKFRYSCDYIYESDIYHILSLTKNINAKNRQHRTILHNIVSIAACFTSTIDKDNILKAIKIFLDYGADPYIEDDNSYTSFTLAAIGLYNSTEILKILLNNKYNRPINKNIIASIIVLAKKESIYDLIEFLLPYVSGINKLPIEDNYLVWNDRSYEINTDVMELLEAYLR